MPPGKPTIKRIHQSKHDCTEQNFRIHEAETGGTQRRERQIPIEGEGINTPFSITDRRIDRKSLRI